MDISRRTFTATALTSTAVAVAGCFGSSADEIALEGDSELPIAVAGDPDADVTVMAFEDYGCGGCASYKTNVYPDIKAAYIDSGQIRYEQRDFPIPADDEWSWEIASAARSVQEQGGDDVFWEFTENIYTHFGEYSLDDVRAVADDVGIDGEQVVEAVEDGRFRDELEAEKERAEDAGVQATPTVVVDDQTVDEPLSYDDVESDIEDAL
ncbi:DsbA family protein [Halostagnicola bangensis]